MAGLTSDQNKFQLLLNKPEHRVSQNDAECKALTDLQQLVCKDITRICGGRYLDINIQGSNGPCDGCKDRIGFFTPKIVQIIQTEDKLVDDLSLRVTVHYYAEPENVSLGARYGRTPLPTTYGWMHDKKEMVDKKRGIEVFEHANYTIIKPRREQLHPYYQ